MVGGEQTCTLPSICSGFSFGCNLDAVYVKVGIQTLDVVLIQFGCSLMQFRCLTTEEEQESNRVSR